MVTCPWCGTNYVAFQPNCKNCGGPLSMPRQEEAPPPVVGEADFLPAPPPAPRPIPDSYAWKLVFANGWSITGIVFGILGVVFSCVGLGLSLAFVTIIIGGVFLLIGIPFLVVGGGVFYWRYQLSMKTVRVLQIGAAVRGQILAVEENYLVEVNNRHPWNIIYRFQAAGRAYDGRVTTLNQPGPQLQAGCPVYVLYLPDAPENNAIYPHP